MSAPQILATLFGLVYIFYAVKNRPIAFFYGIVGCSLWAYEDFANLNLKFDGVLQIFYVLISFYGLYQWRFGGNNKTELPISKLSVKDYLGVLVAGISVSILWGYLGTHFFNTNLPYLDAFTTGFSIIATFLLVKRIIDNWLMWMIINPIYIYIFYVTEAYLFAMISFIYTGMAIKGFLDWKSMLKNQRPITTNKI